MQQSILDMCCGSRMFWFDKQDERAVFSDIRAEQHELCDGRQLVISPDLIADFRALPFANNTFPVVVFDPPHLERVGDNAWMGKKYGRLNKETWRNASACRLRRSISGVVATRCTHLQMERNADPGKQYPGAYRREADHLAAHRQVRQNPLGDFRQRCPKCSG